MDLKEFNTLEEVALFDALQKCCGATDWVVGMMNAAPYDSLEDIMKTADIVWDTCSIKDGKEAFEHHPQIGDKKNLQEKFASTKEWAGKEQSGVDSASSDTIDQLMKANKEYLEKFGYIFIVCATGKTADEMLALLNERLENNPDEEIRIAMAEQHKITKLRLQKLLS